MNPNTSTVTKEPDSIYMTYRFGKEKKVTLELIKKFETLGTIKDFHVETDSEDENVQLARIRFAPEDSGHSTTPTSTQPRKELKATSSVDLRKKLESRPQRREPTRESRNKPESGPRQNQGEIKTTVFTNSGLKPKDSRRLYCLLPWSQREDEREEKFLQHFLQFGPLDYHQVVENRQGYLAFGYVQYRNPRNAQIALKNCDRIYKPKIAEERTAPMNKQYGRKMLVHDLCGLELDEIIYDLHDRTCRLKHELETRGKQLTQKRTPESTLTTNLNEMKSLKWHKDPTSDLLVAKRTKFSHERRKSE